MAHRTFLTISLLNLAKGVPHQDALVQEDFLSNPIAIAIPLAHQIQMLNSKTTRPSSSSLVAILAAKALHRPVPSPLPDPLQSQYRKSNTLSHYTLPLKDPLSPSSTSQLPVGISSSKPTRYSTSLTGPMTKMNYYRRKMTRRRRLRKTTRKMSMVYGQCTQTNSTYPHW